MRHTQVIKPLFIAIFLFSTSLVAIAVEDAPAVHATVDRTKVFIGDRVRYSLEVESRRDIDVAFPKFADNRIGDFEIKDSGSKTTHGIFGSRKISQWYFITAYSVGKHVLPAAEIRYKDRNAPDWSIKNTAEFTIAVESVLPKDGKALDIKDIKRPFSFPEPPFIPIITGFVFVSLMIVAIVTFKRWRRKVPQKPPHEIALAQLMEARDLLAKTGDTKEYHVMVSGALRRYIEDVFGVRAPEMTTEEFLISLNNFAKFSNSQKEALKNFLASCDLVKFAKHMPQKNETEDVFIKAKNFIEETKSFSVILQAGRK